MTFALFVSLACSVQAEQVAPVPLEEPAEPTVQQRSDEATRNMKAFEAQLRGLSSAQLEQAQQALAVLAVECPYNKASLKMIWALDAELPQDAQAREGVDAMIRSLELLGQSRPDRIASLVEAEGELNTVMDEVGMLSEERSATLAAANASLEALELVSRWPPKEAFIGWRDQLRDQRPDLAELMDLQISLMC
jgi:hypothetical protein